MEVVEDSGRSVLGTINKINKITWWSPDDWLDGSRHGRTTENTKIERTEMKYGYLDRIRDYFDIILGMGMSYLIFIFLDLSIAFILLS